MSTRNETAPNRQPNVSRHPGYIGKNSPFKGYPFDNRNNNKTQKLNNKTKINKNKNSIFKPNSKLNKNLNFKSNPKLINKSNNTNDVQEQIAKKMSVRNIKIAQISVKDHTKSKTEILSNIFKEIDVLTIQETHVPEGKTKRLAI